MAGPYRFMLGADATAGQMLVVDPATGKLVPHLGDYGPEAWRLAVDGRAGDPLVWDVTHGYVYPDTLEGRAHQTAVAADEYSIPQRLVVGQRPTMRIRDAAHLLGVHENTIRNYITEGLIEARTLPSGNFRLPYADSVMELVQETDLGRIRTIVAGKLRRLEEQADVLRAVLAAIPEGDTTP